MTQRLISPWHISIGPDGISVSGPREQVPTQIRPGRSCRRSSCPNNVDGVCEADPGEGRTGSLAPFRPLCPEAGDGR